MHTKSISMPEQRRPETSAAIRLSMIAAVDARMGLSREGQIPWDHPSDRRFFREQTMGQCVLLGRRTFESLGNRVLDGRYCAVLSHRTMALPSGWPPGSVYVAPNIEAAISWCAQHGTNLYIAGGASIYAQTLALADELWLSRIEGDYRCDQFFPEIPKCFRIEHAEIRDGFVLEHWRNLSCQQAVTAGG